MESTNLYEVMKVVDVAIMFYACIAIAINGIVWFIMEVFDLAKTSIKKRREKRKAKNAEATEEENDKN